MNKEFPSASEITFYEWQLRHWYAQKVSLPGPLPWHCRRNCLSSSILEWIQPSAVYISNCQTISYHTLQIVCNASTYLQLRSAQLVGGLLLLGCRLFTFYIQQQVNNTTELFNLLGKLKIGAEKAGGSRKKVHILWGYLWKFNWVVNRKWFVSQLVCSWRKRAKDKYIVVKGHGLVVWRGRVEILQVV